MFILHLGVITRILGLTSIIDVSSTHTRDAYIMYIKHIINTVVLNIDNVRVKF